MKQLIKPSRAFFLLSILSIAFNCISPVSLDVNEQGGQVIITGQVSTLSGRTKVEIGLTEKERLPIPLSGAIVKIIDDTGSEFYLYEDEPGTYEAIAVAKSGSSYKVQVMVDNGKIYESAVEVVPQFSPPVSVNYEFTRESYTNSDGGTIENKFVKLYASAQFPVEWADRYLSWEVEEVYIKSPTDFPDNFMTVPPPCYITQKAEPNRIAIYDGARLNSDKLEHQLVCSRIVDHTFLERHYFNTYQASTTAAAFDYWSKVNVLANQTGSIFDTPPARLTGNIKNINDSAEEVFGYFRAVNETYHRFFLVPGYFPYHLYIAVDDCTFRGWDVRYTSFCLDCRTLKNSSYERPEWFGD